jgi:uncharacterized protein YdhG (YjbR/CyaY superfamily)
VLLVVTGMKTEKAAPQTIVDYSKGFPEEIRTLLEQIRSTIRRAAPEATEKISYGIPTFYYNGNLVHFAAFKKHIGFFPTPSAIKEFEKELKDYETSRGTIQFPLTYPLPLKLIERIVRFRVKQNSDKEPTKVSRSKKIVAL